MPGERKIVFIHGLSWKPPKRVLAPRFHRHLAEGAGVPIPEEAVGLAYWADLVGRETDDPSRDEYDEQGPRFRPYSFTERVVLRLRGGLRQFGVGQAGELIGSFFERPQTSHEAALQTVSKTALDALSQQVYASFLTDIHKYLRGGVRSGVKRRLEEELESVPSGAEVCLIAHSMGSMIAADLLATAARPLALLLTIGSPLGIPVVRGQLGLEGEAARRRLADNVRRWVNLYDRLDRVALDHDLADDFPGLSIEDVVIENEFVNKQGERNHHKSYGYLRSPELGRLVRGFLQ